MNQCLAYSFGYVLYNIFFHPLANFPGPLMARSSLVGSSPSASVVDWSQLIQGRLKLWRMIHSASGRFHRSIHEQHKRYGLRSFVTLIRVIGVANIRHFRSCIPRFAQRALIRIR